MVLQQVVRENWANHARVHPWAKVDGNFVSIDGRVLLLGGDGTGSAVVIQKPWLHVVEPSDFFRESYFYLLRGLSDDQAGLTLWFFEGFVDLSTWLATGTTNGDMAILVGVDRHQIVSTWVDKTGVRNPLGLRMADTF